MFETARKDNVSKAKQRDLSRAICLSITVNDAAQNDYGLMIRAGKEIMMQSGLWGKKLKIGFGKAEDAGKIQLTAGESGSQPKEYGYHSVYRTYALGDDIRRQKHPRAICDVVSAEEGSIIIQVPPTMLIGGPELPEQEAEERESPYAVVEEYNIPPATAKVMVASLRNGATITSLLKSKSLRGGQIFMALLSRDFIEGDVGAIKLSTEGKRVASLLEQQEVRE